MKKFAEQIKALIKLYGSQGAMSRAVGIPQSTIGNWAAGHTTPNQNQLATILIALPDLNARWLITGEGDIYKPECSGCVALKESEKRNNDLLNLYVKDKETTWPLIQNLYKASLKLIDNQTQTNFGLRMKTEKKLP